MPEELGLSVSEIECPRPSVFTLNLRVTVPTDGGRVLPPDPAVLSSVQVCLDAFASTDPNTLERHRLPQTSKHLGTACIDLEVIE